MIGALEWYFVSYVGGFSALGAEKPPTNNIKYRSAEG